MLPRCAAYLLAAASILFARNVHGADCEKDNFRLKDQEDADALSNCPTLTGDVIVAATAEGSINLEGVETIRGALSNEECFDGASDDDSIQSLLQGSFGDWEDCRGLESLSATDLVHITGDVTLRSLLDITEVDFKNLEAINGTLKVEYLPHLERMNFSSLELTESIFIRHDRQLANLTMSSVRNVSAEDSVVELVDLGIYEWPRIKIRRPDGYNEPRRRLERLFAKDLPNIDLFEFNNADEIGLLEAHGLSNQTARLQADFYGRYNKTAPREAAMAQTDFQRVFAIDNFTMVGFGGEFGTIYNPFADSGEIDVKHLHFVNNTMETILLNDFVNPKSLYVADNSELNSFQMPFETYDIHWEAIRFHNNPHLAFGSSDTNRYPPLNGGVATSILSIKDCPVYDDWIMLMYHDVNQSLVINPLNDGDDLFCSLVQQRVELESLTVPDEGYTCGGEHYKSVGVNRVVYSSTTWITVACVVAFIKVGWTS